MASIVGSVILSSAIFVREYWYNDILDKLSSAIIVTFLSFVFCFCVIFGMGMGLSFIFSSSAVCYIAVIWVVLWLIWCLVNVLINEFVQDSPGVPVALLGVSTLIYFYWSYFL